MKIRSVRPEFFSDTRMASLSSAARILYIGLWCIADDEGRGRYLPKQIEGEVFPNEQVDIVGLLAELLDSERIVPYQVGEEVYFHIPKFAVYQKPNRMFPSRLPEPPPFTPNGHTADAVRAQRVSSADAPPVLGSGSKGEGEGEGVLAPKTARTDLLFEALCQVTGIDWTELTATGRGPINRALGDLRKVDATPDQIRVRAVNYALRFEAQPTPMALAKHWAQCANAPPNLDRKKLRPQLERLQMAQFLDVWSAAT